MRSGWCWGMWERGTSREERCVLLRGWNTQRVTSGQRSAMYASVAVRGSGRIEDGELDVSRVNGLREDSMASLRVLSSSKPASHRPVRISEAEHGNDTGNLQHRCSFHASIGINQQETVPSHDRCSLDGFAQNLRAIQRDQTCSCLLQLVASSYCATWTENMEISNSSTRWASNYRFWKVIFRHRGSQNR
jgi:hypothetical protein